VALKRPEIGAEATTMARLVSRSALMTLLVLVAFLGWLFA
jgi:hypothetical protein